MILLFPYKSYYTLLHSLSHNNDFCVIDVKPRAKLCKLRNERGKKRFGINERFGVKCEQNL